MNILNTRPSHQSRHLTTLLQQSGNHIFELPLITIQPIPFDLMNTNTIDIFIFQSSNAVNYFFQQMDTSSLVSPTIVAIGSATRSALIALGFHNVLCPEYFSSEGLLAMPLLQDVKHKHIAIVSGENPKTLLNETLSQRGAIVHTVYCYRRVAVSYDMKTVFYKLLDAKINWIICTSGESMHHLLRLFSTPEHHNWLIERKLCVVNDAMKIGAITAGFHVVFQASNATDEAIVGVINA